MATVQLGQPDAPHVPTPAELTNILDADEMIIWQELPDSRFVLRRGHIVSAFAAALFSVFIAFFYKDASFIDGGWLAGLVFFCFCFCVILIEPFSDAWKRRHSFYILTSARAIIYSYWPLLGKRIKSYPITSTSKLELEEDGEWSILKFYTEKARDSEGIYNPTYVGFERIRDGRHVFSLMRQIQSEAK